MGVNVAEIRAVLERRLPEAVGFLEGLVGVNSFTGNAQGVRENARLVAERFAGLGFRGREVACGVPGAGPHLVLEAGPAEGVGGVTIACVSHLDTVYSVEEERRNGFAWAVEGNRAVGPGVCDIKGGTALMYLLLATMAEVEPEVFGRVRWVLLFNAAEEVLAPDFGELCARVIPKDVRACLVFEADGNPHGPAFSLVRARKGMGGFRIRVVGRGAHSGGRYADGANAIHQLARLVDRAQELTDLSRETTVNVGVIRGGTVTNRVPDEAVAELEVRAFDFADFARVREALLGMAGRGDVGAASDGFACRVEVVQGDETPPWPENAQTERLIELWKRAAGAVGERVEASRRGGLSDGNWLSRHFPTLDGLGPRGGNMHVSVRGADGSLPEWVDLGSFVPKALVNYVAIRELLA